MSQASFPQQGVMKAATGRNRRASIRYRCAPATVGKIYAGDDHEFQRAWIIDLSLRGIGILLTRPIRSDSLVIVTMKSNDGQKIYEFSAHVMYCHPTLQGDWNVGCELLNQLTPDDLEHLL